MSEFYLSLKILILLYPLHLGSLFVDVPPTFSPLSNSIFNMAPQTSIPVAANVLGTIGTVFWCVQLVPQIWYNWKKKKTDGLPALMMFLWALCWCLLSQKMYIPLISGPGAVPFGVYAIVQVGYGSTVSDLAVLTISELQYTYTDTAADILLSFSCELRTDLDLYTVQWPPSMCSNTSDTRITVIGRYGKPHHYL